MTEQYKNSGYQVMSESGSSGEDESLCNLEYLLVNLGRNQATADRLIRMFLENAPALNQRLTDAVERGDRAALKDALHDIRSSCVLFSGNRCVELARQFEIAMRQEPRFPGNGQSDWQTLAASLCGCVQGMVKELSEQIESRGG